MIFLQKVSEITIIILAMKSICKKIKHIVENIYTRLLAWAASNILESFQRVKFEP
jgi:hypothetical protein